MLHRFCPTGCWSRQQVQSPPATAAFKHALEPWTYPDATWMSCTWQHKRPSQMTQSTKSGYSEHDAPRTLCSVVPALLKSFPPCENECDLDNLLCLLFSVCKRAPLATQRPGLSLLTSSGVWKHLLIVFSQVHMCRTKDCRQVVECRIWMLPVFQMRLECFNTDGKKSSQEASSSVTVQLKVVCLK